jgi:hypothetical protein
MKPNVIAIAVTVLATNILMASPAFSTDSSAVMATEVQGNVTFVSGGVGEDEAAMFKSAASGYPLELQFVQKATPRDEFLASVKVKITDRSKNMVLDTVTNGPFLLAKLPAGTYRVEADYNGIVKRQSVDVQAGKHGRRVFVWVAADDSPTLNGIVGDSEAR